MTVYIFLKSFTSLARSSCGLRRAGGHESEIKTQFLWQSRILLTSDF